MKLFLLGLVATAALLPATASAATYKCGKSDVGPATDGGSSAVHIRATNIRCRPARVIVLACQNGHRTKGWHVRFAGDRLVMTSGRRTISFELAGGGGCT